MTNFDPQEYDEQERDQAFEDAVFSYLREVPGPFKLYPNPARSDGVFVGQDREIEPYPDRFLDGRIRYPAVPQKAHVYPQQLPHDMAGRLLERLNKQPEETQ